MPAKASIEAAAKAMPMRPASWKERIMPRQITRVGSAVDSRLMARPWMTLVPWPAVAALAIARTGRACVLVGAEGGALYDVGAVAGGRRLGDRAHRTEVRAGIIFSDPDQQGGD